MEEVPVVESEAKVDVKERANNGIVRRTRLYTNQIFIIRRLLNCIVEHEKIVVSDLAWIASHGCAVSSRHGL